MKFIIRLLLPLFALVFSQKMAAQRTFQAGLIAGLTAAQLDGDKSYGFNKPGLQAGGFVSTRLKTHLGASLELVFSQRGAKSQLRQEPGFNHFTVTTNYVDIPLVFHYLDWLVEGSDGQPFHRITFDGGLFYGRFINYRTRCDDDLCDFINKRLELANPNDIGFLLGGQFFSSRHLGFGLRYSKSFSYLFNPKKHTDSAGNPLVNAEPLASYFLTLRTVWKF